MKGCLIKKMRSREELEAMAKRIRLNVAQITHQSGLKGAHLGSCLSMAEILAVLYGDVMHYDVKNPLSPERDRLILSKGHAAVALYAALHEAGFLTKDDIDHALKGDSRFFEHPLKDLYHGIEYSSGSLGQGISFGMGMALGMKKKGIGSKVYVVIGDGECDEGQVWEAAQSIAHFGLTNLTVIMDDNGLQFDGPKDAVLKVADPEGRWTSLGFDVIIVDGHDVEALREALLREPAGKPKVILAKTVKGKGVHFAENEVTWHTGTLTDKLYEEAVRDIND